ncbi:helix-turn-helix domain-containing protein [Paenibacillus sp. MER 180]|uniref:helix-turn-helix domain-containing protein n=1 Tax=Paenibacillus sp. MER 180 TaxID=2939570 RepID=UPI0020414E5E|nr:helix-turn-helix transcriptional regulator [Paenibacillus sp. MER 180]MCM3294140.1 helix-turn-helix domain-containing protein [Paenibacillus sp. MER 180]
MSMHCMQQGNPGVFLLMFKIFCDEVRYRDPLVADGLQELEKMMFTYINEESSRLTFKAARENCAMTVSEVSALTGVEKQLIDDIEKNCSEVYIDVILKLCQCYCISPDHLHFKK